MTRKLLIAYSMTSTHVQTTLDYLRALKSNLGYSADYLHVTHDAEIDIDFDLAGYDIVFNNYCTRFCLDGYVSASYREALKRFNGLKVMAVQDEYDHTNKLKAAIKEYGFQVVLTCVPQDSLEYVYPRAEFPGVEFITVFTGYVPDGFADALLPQKPLSERPIVLGYRGRDIGPRYGRLGFEKFEIGRRMKEICDANGVVNDIAMDEGSRIYGMGWFDFIGNCRAMLGSESGSNVFDFDGQVAAKLGAMKQRLGRLPTYDEFKPVIGRLDNEIDMGQISPRVFECAAMRTPMVLFRGRYSDAILPDEHYIPLELDFSNAEDVLRRLNDLPALQAMSERAYSHIVDSEAFGYRANFSRLRSRFEAAIDRIKGDRSTPRNLAELAISATPFEIQRLALRQSPTPEPEGLERFRAVQARLASYSQVRAGKDPDEIFQRLLQNAMTTVETLKIHYDDLTEKGAPDTTDAVVLLIEKLRGQFGEIMIERASAMKGRESLSRDIAKAKLANDAVAERRGARAVAVHDIDWMLRYTDLHHAFTSTYVLCCDQMTRTILLPTDGSTTPFRKLRRLRSRIAISRAMSQGSNVAFAKSAMKQLPFVREIAAAGLSFLRRNGVAPN
jgi:hypothetical protein